MNRVEMRVCLGSLLAASAVLSVALAEEASEPPTAIVLGTVLCAYETSAEDVESERTLYDHEQHHFMVVDVDRVLSGEVEAPRLLVGVRMVSPELGVKHHPQGRCGEEIVNRSSGGDLIVRITPSGAGASCAPFWIESAGERFYRTEELRPYIELPVFCALDYDVFAVRKPGFGD